MIIPSIIAKSQKEFDKRFEKVRSFSTFHLDVMDGKFVKNKSLQFNFKLPKNKKFEAHLMIKNPKTWIKKHRRKVDSIIIHYKTIKNLHPKLKKKFGIALNPSTSISHIKEYVKEINKVLIMSVNPGRYGSKFLNSTYKKVKELRKLYPKLRIEVDGGINPTTIKKLKKAGATQFVVGSYLQKSKDIKKAKLRL